MICAPEVIVRPLGLLVVLLAISSVASQQPGNAPESANETTCTSTNLERSPQQLLHKVVPKYPSKARKARIEGTVVLWVTITKEGKVTNLKPKSGPTELVPAAVNAVKQWRYAPFKCNGKPVEVETDINVNFELAQ